MDFVELASNATTLAFTIAGDAKTTATLSLGQTQVGDYDYDTDTTNVATVAGGTSSTVQGILYRSRQTQGDEDRANHAIFMIQGSDAPDGVDETDFVTIGGVKWNVYDVELVPTNAVYLLYLRK